MTTPTYIYKIVSSSAGPIPDPLPDRLPVSELDQKDGFIHLSTAKQVAGTLNRFFSGEQKTHLLRIDYSSVKDLIKWEYPQGGKYPDTIALMDGTNFGANEQWPCNTRQ